MRERVKDLGGALEIASGQMGSRFKATIPLASGSQKAPRIVTYRVVVLPDGPRSDANRRPSEILPLILSICSQLQHRWRRRQNRKSLRRRNAAWPLILTLLQTHVEQQD
jgi:hypothetical protein